MKFLRKAFPLLFLETVYKQLENFTLYDLRQDIIVMQHFIRLHEDTD